MMDLLAILLAMVVGIGLIGFIYRMIAKMGFFKNETD